MSEFYGEPMTKEIDLSTFIFGCTLSSPLSNASGVNCTTQQQLFQVLENQYTGYVTSKSCTFEPRKGNQSPRYYDNINYVENGSINSMGIPNRGVDYYLNVSKNTFGKPFVMSVSGLTQEENLNIFNRISVSSKDKRPTAIEFNLSCPNVIGKPQTGLDFEATHDILSKVFEKWDPSICKVGLKLPPYFDIVHRVQAANVFDDYSKSLSFLTCINSPGNGLIIDVNTESTVIHPKEGQGGIGGDFVKPFALANVRSFHELIGYKLDIIGCGGVKNGRDVFEHILCGAKAVQVGTLIARRGVDEFRRLSNELRDIMLSKGYSSISEFRGKLKTIKQTSKL
jgi:dihydroorotate dehydrogenase (fumarate)